MRPPQRASRCAPVDSRREAARSAPGKSACAPGPKRTPTPASRRAGAAAPPQSPERAATGEAAAPAAATSKEAAISGVTYAVLLGRADLAAALLDAGVAPRGYTATDLLFAACADEPLRVPSVNLKIPTNWCHSGYGDARHNGGAAVAARHTRRGTARRR